MGVIGRQPSPAPMTAADLLPVGDPRYVKKATTEQVVSVYNGGANNYGGSYRIVQGDGTATQWGAVVLPDTLAGATNANNYWMMGRGNSISERRWTHHIPSYADYSNTGAIPSWQVCYTGDIPILKASADGTVYAKGGIYRPDVNGMVVGAAPSNNGYGLWFDTDSNTAYGATTYFTTGGYFTGDLNQMGFIGGSVPRWSISLNSGEIMHWYQRCAFDRAWDNYPSISVKNDTTYGGQGEFRIHGIGGASGGDFSVATRSDGGFISGSDARRKSNIEPITNALQTVMQLQGKKFNLINRDGDLDPMRGERKQYGLIAQDSIEFIPEVVTHYPEVDTPNENGWASAYSIDYPALVPLLIEAIKEQQTIISTLQARIEALEVA